MKDKDIKIELMDYKDLYVDDTYEVLPSGVKKHKLLRCNCCGLPHNVTDHTGIRFNSEAVYVRLCKECLNKLELIILNKYNYNILEQENIELNNEIYLLHKERKLLQAYVGETEDRFVMLEDYIESKSR